MSRHRNVRKLNIAEERDDDYGDYDDYDEDEELDFVEKQVVKKPSPAGTSQVKSPSKKETAKPVAVAPKVENLRIDADICKSRSGSKSPARALTPKQAQSNLEIAINTIPKYKHRVRPTESKQALNLVIIGHVDAGKSTLVGHLLYQLGNVEERAMHRFRQDSSRLGKSSFAFAWILDESEEERTRGVTMDIAKTSIELSGGRKFHVLDAPGHKDFIPNMISGATQADAALLLVNSTRGEFETGFDQGGQTREHALLVRALGVSRLIVAVNKLDTVDWSQQRYLELCAILDAFLHKRVGFESVQFVPVSGLLGINLTEKPPTDHPLAAWHSDGSTLVEMLGYLPLPSSSLSEEQSLRIVVNDVLRSSLNSLTVSAKVAGGNVESGDKLFLMPEAVPAIVKAISSLDDAGLGATSSATIVNQKLTKSEQIAYTGDQIHLTLSGAFEPDSVYPGNVLCRGGPELLLPCQRFSARLVTFDIRTPILQGTHAELFVHSLWAPCVLSRLLRIHPGAKELEKRNPRLLPRNVSAIVEIRTDQAISIEPFAKNKHLGRIALRSCGETIAAGIVIAEEEEEQSRH